MCCGCTSWSAGPGGCCRCAKAAVGAGMLEPLVIQHASFQKRLTRLLGAMTADLLGRVQTDSADNDR